MQVYIDYFDTAFKWQKAILLNYLINTNGGLNPLKIKGQFKEYVEARLKELKDEDKKADGKIGED